MDRTPRNKNKNKKVSSPAASQSPTPPPGPSASSTQVPRPPLPKCNRCGGMLSGKRICIIDKFNKKCAECDRDMKGCFFGPDNIDIKDIWRAYIEGTPNAENAWTPPALPPGTVVPERRNEKERRLKQAAAAAAALKNDQGASSPDVGTGPSNATQPSKNKKKNKKKKKSKKEESQNQGKNSQLAIFDSRMI